jgi:CBS domain containing-hemolysin-like protein
MGAAAVEQLEIVAVVLPDWLWAVVIALVVLGSLLALAETSISRMSKVRAIALVEEGRRNADILKRIEDDPARYLNTIYLSVMLAQNGSAILVALLAESYFGDLGITLVSVGFTLLYFVLVEAMSKTFGILHSDGVALALAPFAWFLSRMLALPARALIGLANVLLPGRGLPRGPFVTEQEIRTMAEVASDEEQIEKQEASLIHSIFEFGDTRVGDVMVPRPDVVSIEGGETLARAQELVFARGFSRIPVFRGNLDDMVGIVHAKDLFKAIHERGEGVSVGQIARPAHFVPEVKRAADLLWEMQQNRFHMVIVVNEHGSVSGLVALEDLLEELVGEITDEFDREDSLLVPLGDDRYQVDGRMAIEELNEVLGVDLPHQEWRTVGGLMLGALGRMPVEGDEVRMHDLVFTAQRIRGHRIIKVLMTRV